MFAPAHGGSKRTDSIRNARVQGAPHCKKKIRLKVPDERREGTVKVNQSQPPTVVGRSGDGKHNCQQQWLFMR